VHKPLDERDVGNFYEQLAFKLQTARIAQRRLDLYLASGLNIVRAYIEPNENRVSDMLAHLLDPKGLHGQGDRFLRLFLETVPHPNIPFREGRTVNVSREARTSLERKMDILLDFDGEEAIALENKIDARDQDNQVNHYCNELEWKYKGKYVLFYLTPQGKAPDSIEADKRLSLEKERKLICISYRSHIGKWLELSIRQSEAEKVRWFLKDLAEYVFNDIVGRDSDGEVGHNVE
jgi:hypothetical protein